MPKPNQLCTCKLPEALESVHQGEDRAELCAQLAFHFARGHKPERAYDYYVRLEIALRSSDFCPKHRLHYREALRASISFPQDLQRKRERIDLIFKLMQSSFVSIRWNSSYSEPRWRKKHSIRSDLRTRWNDKIVCDKFASTTTQGGRTTTWDRLAKRSVATSAFCR